MLLLQSLVCSGLLQDQKLSVSDVHVIQTTLGTTYKCFSFILVIADIPTLFSSILMQTCQAYHNMSAVQYVTNQYADLTSW